MTADKLWVTAAVGAMVYVLMKQWRPEAAPLVLLAAVGAAAGICLQSVGEVRAGAEGILQQTELSEFLVILLKCAAFCTVSKICGDLCRDSGATALATGVETGGRLLALAAALPLFRAVAALAVSLCQ